MKYKGMVLIDDTDDTVQNPVFRLKKLTTDPTGESGVMWFRADLGEIKVKVDGTDYVLADKLGPRGGAYFNLNYDPTETVYVSIQNPISFVP